MLRFAGVSVEVVANHHEFRTSIYTDMTFENAFGSAFLVAQRKKSGGWNLQWCARLNFPGAAALRQFPRAVERVTLINLRVPMCVKCEAALALPAADRSAAFEACKARDCRKLAWARCESILRAWSDELWAAMTAPPPPPEPAPVPAAGATVNDVLDAWAMRWAKAMDANASKEARRQATSFMRVLAFGHDAWVVKDAGDGRRGVRVGEKQADMSKLGPMLLSEALTRASAQRYFENACAAAGVPCSWARSNARHEHVTINRTMQQARCLFTKLAMQFVYDGITLPDSLAGWKSFQLLPEPSKIIDPIVGDDFKRMVEAREAMKLADPQLYLVNKVLTQTGIRSGSVQEMRGDWAVMDNGVWKLHAKEVKSGTIQYAVPITEELAREIQAAGMTNDECRMTNDGFCFGETEAARHEVVCSRHNAWLKSLVAGPRHGSQGNHRLRKTLASAIRALRGIDEARKLLGHADKEVTEASYAAVGVQVTPEMRQEFAAFL